MTQDARFEDILDECIDRLGAGEAPEDVLRSYPQHAVALLPLLQSAARANAPAPPPDATARAQTMNGMLASIESARNAGRSRASGLGGVAVWSSWLGKRPLAYRGLALLTGVALVGGVAAGASAAGTGPKPVREFFGFQSDSLIRVEFDGVIVGTNAVNGELTVQTGSDVRTVIVTGTTELSDGGDSIAFEDLALGDHVEVKGTLQLDNTILASRVHREDGLGDDQGGDGTPSTTLGNETATPDDHEDGVDDNSGPASGTDDAEVDDAGDDNSGPDSGADDELEDESPSSTDEADELDDDSADSSSDDADELEDHSSGSGSDDETELDDSPDSSSTETPDDHSSDLDIADD